MGIFPQPSPESPPMFESRFIDRFSRTHWATVPMLFVPAITALLWWSVAQARVSVPATVALFVFGFFVWTLSEYALHRSFFHWTPKTGWGPRLHFLAHGVHHDWPTDKYRLVMPPAISISLFWLTLGVWVLLLGRFAWSFHAGYVVGYIYYDCMHYFIHHAKPKAEWARALRKHHLVHHSPNLANGRKFGVSTTFWDHVFRTY